LKNIKLILFAILVFSACSKNQVEVPLALPASDFFPLKMNSYWIYDALKIDIDAPVDKFDTSRFELKVIINDFDSLTQLYEFWRYTRPDSLSEWVIFDIVSVDTNTIGIQSIEDNLRFLKLSDPIILDKTWDGNSFNILPAWDYSYTDISGRFENEYLEIKEVIRVDERNVVNLLQQEIAWEIYGKNVGLVFKHEEVLKLEANKVKTGHIIEYNLIKYGIE